MKQTCLPSFLTCPNRTLCMNEFMRWAAKWQLQMAELLSHGNVTQPMYYVHAVQLPNVNACRDLGVFVDSHCNYVQHMSHIFMS